MQPCCDFFPIFSVGETLQFYPFLLVLTYFILTRTIQLHRIVVLVYTKTHFDPVHVLRQPIQYLIILLKYP